MPKSKPHSKRKVKLSKKNQKFVKWADRRIHEWNAMSQKDREKHGEFIGFWRDKEGVDIALQDG